MLVLTKSCWSRTDGPALVFNTVYKVRWVTQDLCHQRIYHINKSKYCQMRTAHNLNVPHNIDWAIQPSFSDGPLGDNKILLISHTAELIPLTESRDLLVVVPHVRDSTSREHEVDETLTTVAVQTIDQRLIRVLHLVSHVLNTLPWTILNFVSYAEFILGNIQIYLYFPSSNNTEQFICVVFNHIKQILVIDGFVQDCSNSTVLAMAIVTTVLCLSHHWYFWYIKRC